MTLNANIIGNLFGTVYKNTNPIDNIENYVEIAQALDMATGNQVVTPTNPLTDAMIKVTIIKPATLIAANIKAGVVIGGITGSYTGTSMRFSFDISADETFTEAELVEIIANLATGVTEQTLTMGAVNLAKLSSAEIAVAITKGWTLI